MDGHVWVTAAAAAAAAAGLHMSRRLLVVPTLMTWGIVQLASNALQAPPAGSAPVNSTAHGPGALEDIFTANTPRQYDIYVLIEADGRPLTKL